MITDEQIPDAAAPDAAATACLGGLLDGFAPDARIPTPTRSEDAVGFWVE